MHKHLKFIALCLLAALVVWWFGRDLDWAGVRAALARSNRGMIAAAVALVSATYLIRAFRWRALLAPLAPEVSLRELFAATTVGFGAVFLAGRTGEVVRPAFLPLRDRRVRPGAAFVTIAVERIYDMVAIVVLFAANLLFFRPPSGNALAYQRIREAGLVLLLAAVAGVAGLVWFRRHAARVTSWLDARLERWPALVRRVGLVVTGLLQQLSHALGVLVDARGLFVTVGWTTLLWACIALADLLILRAFGLPFGLAETVFVMGWSLVGSLVPTPGGAAGTFHAATAAGLIFLGVARTEAAAAAIVMHLVMFGTALFYGLYYFLRSDVSLARIRGLVAEEGEQKEGRAGEDDDRSHEVGTKTPREARA